MQVNIKKHFGENFTNAKISVLDSRDWNNPAPGHLS